MLPSCYDEWILPERERLRQRFMTALERLVELLENERDYALAIRYALDLLQADPLNETTYRCLMGLYALNGNQARVQRIYQECVTILRDELAAEPNPAAWAAYKHLLKLDVADVPLHNLPPHLTPSSIAKNNWLSWPSFGQSCLPAAHLIGPWRHRQKPPGEPGLV